MWTSRLARVVVAASPTVVGRLVAPAPTAPTCAGLAGVSSTRRLHQEHQHHHPALPEGAGARNAGADQRMLWVQFGDDATRHEYPHTWLRENCQCSQCFNSDAMARLFLLDQLHMDVQPKDVQVCDGGVRVTWSDGHESQYSDAWLLRRAFTPEARAARRACHALPKERWGNDFDVPRLDYGPTLREEAGLLKFLVTLERWGVVVLHDAPTRVGPVTDLIDTIGFVKPTHYGKDYSIFMMPEPNNLAYTASRLGLHTDLPYYQQPPGTTWLHCIRQHEGVGGDNDLSDGIRAAEELRARHPHHFHTLTATPVYFQDQGFHTYYFYKSTKEPVISLDVTGEVRQIYMSSQARDSFQDMDAESVYQFYEALKQYNNILYEFSIRVKTKPGDILVLDNTRVLHGRTHFTPSGNISRHLHNAYIDWDELRSKRRILQEKLNVT